MSQQHENLLDLEQVAIQKALSVGHKNPRECEKHQACLYASGADRKIVDYRLVEISEIITGNVRVRDVDPSYCKEEIAPLIERKAIESPETRGLNYPLLVEQRAGKYQLIHGHNRRWCLQNISREKEVPVFIVDSQGTEVQKLKGMIKANSRSEDANRKYTMQDIVLQVQDFERRGGFTNKSNEELTLSEFHNFMDDCHPYQFTSKIPRGKIFSKWKNSSKKANSVHITWDDSLIDSVIARNGYSSRYHENDKGRTVKTEWPQHIDQKQECFIGIVINDDVTLPTKLYRIIEGFLDEDFAQKYKDYSIHLIVKLRNIPANEFDLKKQQINYLEKLNTANKILSNCSKSAILIEKVIFPTRLKSQKSDCIFKYNRSLEKFE